MVSALSHWFKRNARVLPWRANPDSYWVWLSEIMLQQTQVTTVLPYFDRFIKKFPEVTDLAHASIDEVYSLWAGLGYYSRARNLHKGAQAIAARLQAKEGFPKSREEWLAIPGVGEYTAGAICSIALNQREPIVDGNVVRVLSRVFAIEKLDAKKTRIWKEAKALVEEKKAVPRSLNQSLMELGALICKPKNPKCSECPIEAQCKGKRNPERYPEPKLKTVWKHVAEEKWVLIRKRGKISEFYLEQNSKEGWREGLWDFPDAQTGTRLQLKKNSARTKLIAEFESKYTVTTHKIIRKHTVLEVAPEEKALFQNGGWFSLEKLPALPSPVKKAILKVSAGAFD